MAMELDGVSRTGQASESLHHEKTTSPQSGKTSLHRETTTPSAEALQASVDNLNRFSQTLNRRLKFTINRELERVVVKVIDNDTDKVIKEIPPEAIQRLYTRIRDALGLLFDESV
jgi:flagellar protein FlaG